MREDSIDCQGDRADRHDVLVPGSGESRKYLAGTMAVAGPCIADGLSTI
jgi:hypothetical protein